MYTQSPCSAPSGTTVIPQSMIAAAQAAATAAINNGATDLGQVMQAVNAAVAAAATKAASNPNTTVDPNAAPMAAQAGYSTAVQGLADKQVINANKRWLRIIQRQPGDFAGMTLPPSEFNVPQLSAQLFNNPSISGAHRPVCQAPGRPPQILPIQGGFGYQPAAAQLFTHPSPPSAPPLQASTPVSFQPASPVPSSCPAGQTLNDQGVCITPAWNDSMSFDQIQAIRQAQGVGLGNFRRLP